MSCTSPLPITLKRQDRGKHAHKHTPASDKRPSKYTTKFGEGYHDFVRYVSCGQCGHCRKRKAADATIRTVHESTLHDTNLFVTLTLSPENRPFPPNPNIDIHQKFIKRVRKNIGPCRYSSLREHGSHPNYRPHWHTILFGLDLDDLQERPERPGKTLFESKRLAAAWGLGHIHIRGVNPGTAAYAQLHNKLKITGKAAKLAYADTVDTVTGAIYDRDPPRINASLKPGIGKGWYDQFKEELWQDGSVIFQGRPAAIPRYYLQLMEEEDPSRWATFAAHRREQALLRKAAHPEEETPERRKTREEVLRLRNLTFTREDVL